jgi:hypothetical protein
MGKDYKSAQHGIFIKQTALQAGSVLKQPFIKIISVYCPEPGTGIG